MLASTTFKRILLAPVVALLIAVMSLSCVSAYTPVFPDEITEISESDLRIKIIIIIIIRKKKKGVVEVEGMRLGQKSSILTNNEILAEASVEGNQFLINAVRGEHAKSLILLPDYFKVSKDISLKLGEKSGILLKKGSIDFRVNKLGNFEIQD